MPMGQRVALLSLSAGRALLRAPAECARRIRLLPTGHRIRAPRLVCYSVTRASHSHSHSCIMRYVLRITSRLYVRVSKEQSQCSRVRYTSGSLYRCETRCEAEVRWRISCCARVQVQGMSFLAAVLLLNLDEADAFLALANLLNRPLLLAFYRLDNAAVCELHPPLYLSAY